MVLSFDSRSRLIQGVIVDDWASHVAVVIKNPPANAGDKRVVGSVPGWEDPCWRRVRQPTLVFLPGESYGQRSLVGYSSWGHTELDMTKVT